ncbi:hypothetical protein ACQ4PT_024704 [Festuca glaucescens]
MNLRVDATRSTAELSSLRSSCPSSSGASSPPRRRRPRPTADPRSLDGLSRPGSLRYPPHRRRRGPSLRAAPRVPSVPLPPPRGVLQLPQKEGGEGRRLQRGCYFCSDACREHAKGFHGIENNLEWSLLDDHCSLRGLKYPYMVKRLACMVISGAVGADSLDILQPARLHQGIISEMEEEFELLDSTFRKAGFQEELAAFFTKQWYINVLARIRVNAFRIELVASSYDDLLSSAIASVACDASFGNAVYMLPSFYNHDCDPNTHIVWLQNADAKLKTLRDIDEGEELRICYIDASMDVNARQKILAEGFGFECHCLRCLSGD